MTHDYSADWYRVYARRYAEVSAQFLQSVYIDTSHPGLRDDNDIYARLMELVPVARDGPRPKGLDAGCGAGARDVQNLQGAGYDMTGVDAIEENIAVAHALHPELRGRVSVHDLREPLPFAGAAFDFVICNSVIQHIDPPAVTRVVLPELARVLAPGGVLQLMFKNGDGVTTVYDKDYGSDRTFQLFDEHEVLALLEGLGMALVSAEAPEKLGGLLYCTDPKAVRYCLMWCRKG